MQVALKVMCFFFKIIDVGMQEWLNILNLIYVFFHLRESTHGCFIPMYDKIHYKKKKKSSETAI